MKRLAAGLVSLSQRPARVILVALLLSGLAILPARQVRVQANLANLLPDGSPAANDYRVFLERFGGLEKVFVMVLPDPAGQADAADLIHAAGLLEQRLAASPEVASVRGGLDERDEELFLRYVVPRAPLLVSSESTARRITPEAIRQRVAQLKAAVSTPAWSAQGALYRGDPLGFSDELVSSMAPSGLPLDLMTSAFLAPSRDAALLILTPARSEVDPEGGRALLAELEVAQTEMRSEMALPLEFRAVGGPLYAAWDEELIRRDLQRTLSGSLIGTSLILLAAFEGVLLPLAALFPLLAGLLWTAAGMGLAGAEISAISIGFGAVLVGLGIDYGIHTGARFRQSLLVSGDARGALAETVRHTGPGILTSALTTAAGFIILTQAHFRPLRELGQLVPLGISAIVVAVAVVGGAALMLVAPRLRRVSETRRGPVWNGLGRVVEISSGLSVRHPKVILGLAGLVSTLALVSLGNLSVNPDLATFRPDNHPAREGESLLSERFGLGLDTANVVVHGRDLREALLRARRAGDVLEQALGDGAEISNPADFLAVGPEIDARLTRLASLPLDRAADDLERELRAVGLNPRGFARGIEALRTLGRGEDPGVAPAEAWPDWLAEAISSDPRGSWTVLSLRLTSGTWPAGPPPELLNRLESVAPGAAIASAVAVGGELRDLARRDLSRLGLLALAAVALVVRLSFMGTGGALRRSLLACLPVLLGCLWTFGLWAALDRSLDLFTLAVLPILLGIGIDDGLHVMHGARTEDGIEGAVRGAGRALVLTTLTTCVGFGSLLFSHLPGLRNGGALIATGVLACLLATLMVLPAIEAVHRPTAGERT